MVTQNSTKSQCILFSMFSKQRDELGTKNRIARGMQKLNSVQYALYIKRLNNGKRATLNWKKWHTSAKAKQCCYLFIVCKCFSCHVFS